MPLGKADDPKNYKPATPAKVESAIQDVLDEGAGAPPGQMKAAEALPEKDEVQVGIKEAMLADTGQEEASAKADVVAASPDAPDTPSGGALEATKGISDNVERGEAYAREKSQRRWGYVTSDLKEEEKK
jgi:hypothetical protein